MASWAPILDNSEDRDRAWGARTGVWVALPSNSEVSEAGSQTSHPANKQCKKSSRQRVGAGFENDTASLGMCLEVEDHD